MSLQTLADAFHDELRDVLSAEKQLVKALPKMAKAASSEDPSRRLREAPRGNEDSGGEGG